MILPLIPITILDKYDEDICRRVAELDEHFAVDPSDPLYGPPFRYFLLFEKWPSLINATSPLTSEVAFYNKYYWFLKLIRLWQLQNGFDAGMEQQAAEMLKLAVEDERFTLNGAILEHIETLVTDQVDSND